MPRKLATSICNYCGNPFERQARFLDPEKTHYCTLKCFADKRKSFVGRRLGRAIPDRWSQFRWFKTVLENRVAALSTKRSEMVIGSIPSLEDLESLWNRQNGKCPYTGWDLILPKNSSGFLGLSDRHRYASIDRKDSSLGYELSNIQFVAMIANLAKNSFSESVLRDFCLAVSQQITK